ncbi:MAG: hypothetical protein ACO3BI_06295, partial [Candidatus Nanopelagicales bacterium]
VLSTPPAFVLSQDQTLRKCFLQSDHRSDHLAFDKQAVVLVISFASKKSAIINNDRRDKFVDYLAHC